jgi:hypothetical protein
MKTLIIAIAVSFIPFIVQSEEKNLSPLNLIMAQRSNWDDDIGEVAFVGSRCSALFFAVGSYFVSNGTTPSDKKSGEDLRQRSSVLMFASVILGKLSKLEEQDTHNRIKVFLGLYMKNMANNKLLLNNALDTPVAEDLKFCNQHEHNYVRVSQMYDNELEKAKRTKK